MKAAPLFSIILPTHDRPGPLREAIVSVLAQTVGDFELLVVDDGSRVPAVIPDDARIRLIRLETNQGPAAARNTGRHVARGRYLTFLDDDDRFTPDRLELALHGLVRAPISLCWARFVDHPAGRGRTLEGWVHDSILDGSTPTLGLGAYVRTLAPPFDERWHAVEDVVWWLHMSRLAPVTTVPRVGYLVGRYQGPRNRNHLQARIEENLRLLEVFADYFSTHRRGTAFRLKRIGFMARATGDHRLARSALARSFWHRPQPATAWHLLRTVASR